MAGNQPVFTCNDKNASACELLDKNTDKKIDLGELSGAKNALFLEAFKSMDPATQGKTLIALAPLKDNKFASAFNSLYPLRTPRTEKPALVDKVAETLFEAVKEWQQEKLTVKAAGAKLQTFFQNHTKVGEHGNDPRTGGMALDTQLSHGVWRLIEKMPKGSVKEYIKEVMYGTSLGG